MRKTKSYNRIPSFKADFAIYAAVGVAATVVAAPLLYGVFVNHETGISLCRFSTLR